MKYIRNFSIIAHIDHGKSTLSDRLIERCGNLTKREMKVEQILDSMDLERERGITIKARSVTLNYVFKNKKFQFNFIDTPGHVDFSYEVSRSLAACEGAILLIDAKKGVEAQTHANYFLASKMNLKIITVLNKIDLDSSDPKLVSQQVKNIFGISEKDIIYCSAKTGFGIDNILKRLISDIPSPKGDSESPLQALIIDSWFDNYLGVISLVCIKNGKLSKGSKIKVMSTGNKYFVEKLGIFTPNKVNCTVLNCGEVGWIVCGIKNIKGAPVGDTLTCVYKPALQSLPDFKKIKPQPKVFASLFPIESKDYNLFQNALKKLSLNDSSIFYESESSNILGFGFRCGFLGLLHMEIIQERLEREYNLKLIKTAPTVIYEVKTNKNNVIYINNPSQIPDHILELREPICECHIIFPKDFLGKIIKLCIEKRGLQIKINYFENQISMIWEIPMIEIIFDFFDRIKSISNGYASLNYFFKRFQFADLVRLDILINNEKIDAMSLITHRNNAIFKGRILVEKIKNLMPRKQFDIIIQASINNRIVARSSLNALRKNVTAKCYGGDISRKKKLLKKQKIGKKRLKRIGNIELPQDVFLSILKIEKFNK